MKKKRPPREQRPRATLDRREFMLGSTAAMLVAGTGLGGCCDECPTLAADGAAARPEAGPEAGKDSTPAPDQGKPDSKPKDATVPTLKGRVVEITDPKSISTTSTLDAARVKAMLQAALRDLTGQQDLYKAWKVLLPNFYAQKRIGLKVNTINSKACNSSALLLALIETLVKDLGADAKNIIVWDRTAVELANAKLTTAGLGVNVMYTDPPGGVGFDDTLFKISGKETAVSALLTMKTDITINLGVLKDHDIGGITGALKNSFGMISNPGDYHTTIAKDLPEIYNISHIKGRVRLCILEGFLAVAQGGPMGPPTHKPGKLLVSIDPVAIDAHALTVINSLRKTPVASSMLGWLPNAVAKGLGTSTPTVVKRTMT